MSILSGVMNLGRKAAVNFTKRGAVETQKVLHGKVNVPNYNVSGLINSPKADEFIASAAKQKANILSDNLVKFSDGTLPYRVITKRLPSGTTVTQAFDVNGLAYKEVLSKKGHALSYNASGTGRSNVALVYDYQKGVGRYKPMHATAAEAKFLPNAVEVSDPILARAKGMTALSNAKNPDYQALAKMGMIYTF